VVHDFSATPISQPAGVEVLNRVLDSPTDAISGAAILDDIEAFFRRFVVMEEAAYTISALWVVHTYAYKTAVWTPYMAITSAEKRCGKSHYLEVAEYLVRSPLKSDDISPAALFRSIEKYQPTMLLDEQDAAKNGDKEKYEALRGVLNSGAKYNGKVHRVVGKGKDMDVQAFSTFSPKAVAGIGCLADTVADRSIPIRLKRKLPSEKIDYLDDDKVRPVAESLKQRISDWANRAGPKLKGATPQMPTELNDRQKDGARSLLAIYGCREQFEHWLGHADERDAVDFVQIEDTAYMRVRQLTCESNFLAKPFVNGFRTMQRWSQELESYGLT